MSPRKLAYLAALAVLFAVALAAELPRSLAQPSPRESASSNSVQGARFEFEVIESFDARYLGDTPGHSGRSGGLDKRRPRMALGDPVYRGSEKVGILTQIDWDRTGGSLALEFDPQPLVRVNVGDVVWVSLDGATPEPKQ